MLELSFSLTSIDITYTLIIRSYGNSRAYVDPVTQLHKAENQGSLHVNNTSTKPDSVTNVAQRRHVDLARILTVSELGACREECNKVTQGSLRGREEREEREETVFSCMAVASRSPPITCFRACPFSELYNTKVV